MLLGEAARLVEQIAPPLRGHAGGFEDVERAGDGRGERRLIAELAGEVVEEGSQPLPVLALIPSRAPTTARLGNSGDSVAGGRVRSFRLAGPVAGLSRPLWAASPCVAVPFT